MHKRAADAGLFVDYRDQWHIQVFAVLGIEFQHLGVEQVGECCNGGLAAWRTLIDRCFAIGDGFGVRPATRERCIARTESAAAGRQSARRSGLPSTLNRIDGVTEYQAE